MSDPELLNAQVDFDGLLEVLGQHLYSTPKVVLRELVQNAHDSCNRRALEAEVDDTYAPRITVAGDLGGRTLTITDNGAGLTKDEIVRYLATVGAGYTRVLRKRTGHDGLIGAFGLGFLSAYVVADKVEVCTTSYQSPELRWRFTSRGGRGFVIEAAEPGPVGTTVVLHLGERFEGLADSEALRRLLARYCLLLPLPVFAPDRINDVPVPWRADESALPVVRRRALRLAFARRFETHFEPLCTLPLGDGPAQGLLWVQDHATYGSFDNRRLVLFVRGMLITEDARDLVPRWAGFIGGVLECDTLTPTASREAVQEDAAFAAVQAQVSEALIEGLAELARSDRAAWRRVLSRHNEPLLGAALVDPRLFRLLESELRLPTSVGDLPAPRIAERSQRRIVLGSSEGTYEEVLFRALDVPIIDATRYAARPFATQYAQLHGLTLTELGTRASAAALFKPAELDPAEVATLEALFASDDVQVQVVRFEPPSLPAVLVADREVMLKRRLEQDEADRRISAGILGLARMFTETVQDQGRATFYVNAAAPVVQRVLQLPEPARARAARLVRAIALLLSRQTVDLEIDVRAELDTLSSTLELLLGA